MGNARIIGSIKRWRRAIQARGILSATTIIVIIVLTLVVIVSTASRADKGADIQCAMTQRRTVRAIGGFREGDRPSEAKSGQLIARAISRLRNGRQYSACR